jgi:branched-chain amino acid transport system ATP-binding protein
MSRLSLAGVAAGYGLHEVVTGVSLSVPDGAVVALVGPNGHGKTTLLKALSGLIKTSAGRIEFAQQEITNRRPEAIAQLGIAHVPQGDLLFPLMTALENLLMGAFWEKSRAAIESRLNMVFELFPKLKSVTSQTANSLSGGERRMVGIGRGLMAGASLMLIDEPSLGLAPIVIDQVYSAISMMKSKNVSVLLVEENPERAASVAEHVYLLDRGKIAWSGESKELLASKNVLHTYLGM